ncbi:hypothetical protein BJF93_18885 [Xaviernesmea oryzae]|uniref:HTH lacI-type domain-containing protein n=1 Tax=Xaviernesmea oryzae TaxID=464029 RepID=A0A1Q9B2M7_9HYPH|nr:LacI family DNA-binding transcriptional regulator [Xaviernesmea oryzae]OLP62281.1 hypothetical protein BJF93_18885 [Xaviernesmea oryzae]SEL94417.1 transcriptional regulator, LacI family [Xaviernesmea oryzae]
MATIRDVARHAGVAISTVSLALNGTGPVSAETRARILEAVAAVKYSPNLMAQNLKRGQSKLIGLVLGDLGNPFFGKLLRTVDRKISEADHMLIVADTDSHPHREIRTLNQLKRQRVAGIIMAPLRNDADFAAYLNQIDVPVVLIDQDVDGARLDFVSSDHQLAAGMLTEYLLRLGHSRIAYLGGTVGLWTAQRRLEGFEAAMRSAGCPIDPELVVDAEYSAEKSYDQVVRLMSRHERPTAFLAANNFSAIGALQAINDLGFRCPEDVSIAGIDGVPWGSVIKPRITTAEQPIEELAGLAATWMLEHVQGEVMAGAPSRRHIALPRLVIGQSCAPPAVSAGSLPLRHG